MRRDLSRNVMVSGMRFRWSEISWYSYQVSARAQAIGLCQNRLRSRIARSAGPKMPLDIRHSQAGTLDSRVMWPNVRAILRK